MMDQQLQRKQAKEILLLLTSATNGSAELEILDSLSQPSNVHENGFVAIEGKNITEESSKSYNGDVITEYEKCQNRGVGYGNRDIQQSGSVKYQSQISADISILTPHPELEQFSVRENKLQFDFECIENINESSDKCPIPNTHIGDEQNTYLEELLNDNLLTETFVEYVFFRRYGSTDQEYKENNTSSINEAIDLTTASLNFKLDNILKR